MKLSIKTLFTVFLILVIFGGAIFFFRDKISNFLVDKAWVNALSNNLTSAQKYLMPAKFLNANKRYYFVSGYVAWLRCDYDQALEYYTRALELGFNPPERILINRADIYERKGDYETALRDYREALKINPANLLVQYRIADVNIRLGNAKDAVDILKNIPFLAKSNIQKIESYNLLGRAYYIEKLYKEAVDAFKKSLELNPNQKVVSVQLARYLRNMGDIQGIDELNKLLDIDPSNRLALCALAATYDRAGDSQKSIEMSKKALSGGKVAWDNIDCLFGLGEIYYRENNLKDARGYIEVYLANLERLKLSGPEYGKVKSEAEELLAKMMVN